MLIFRWIVTLLLLMSAVSFVFWVATGQAQYKRCGLMLLKWTLIAAFAFFAVLIFGRIV